MLYFHDEDWKYEDQRGEDSFALKYTMCKNIKASLTIVT